MIIHLVQEQAKIALEQEWQIQKMDERTSVEQSIFKSAFIRGWNASKVDTMRVLESLEERDDNG